MELRYFQLTLAALLHALLLVVGLWDIYCLFYDKRELTVSSIIQDWAMANPILPLAVGVLLGHLFWPRMK